MGAATAMAFALDHPARVEALVQITPAYDGGARTGSSSLETWDARADAIAAGDIDAFVRADRRRRAARADARGRPHGGPPARRAPRAPRGRGRGAAPGAALRGLRRPGPARGPGPAGAGGGQPRRRRPRAPAGRGAPVRRPAAAGRARRRGRGRAAAGLAGRAPVARDRRVPRSATRRARCRCARWSRPPARPPSSPGSCPSTAAPARARPPARPGARSGAGCPRRPRRTAASSTAR